MGVLSGLQADDGDARLLDMDATTLLRSNGYALRNTTSPRLTDWLLYLYYFIICIITSPTVLYPVNMVN